MTEKVATADEDLTATLRPIDLARAADISPSLVRNYEQQGFLAPAIRTRSGQRRYTEGHRRALLLARALRNGYGWSPALAAMRAINSGDFDEALATANRCHAELHSEELRLRRAFQAVNQAAEPTRGSTSRALSIGAAAAQLGVTTATLRHWEAQGVVEPRRLANGRRTYSAVDLRKLELARVLRSAGYDFTSVSQLTAEFPTESSRTRAALATRQRRLQQQTRAAVEATRQLAEYLRDTQ
jgi:DNA-binding transcriptional MerR regulator